jgi:hypothetical protein
MDLREKFLDVGSCTILSINKVELDKKYPIKHARRVYTMFGPTILLTLKDPVLRPLKFFLPRRYSDVFSDDDVGDKNSAKVRFYLIYEGQCAETKSFKLEIV